MGFLTSAKAIVAAAVLSVAGTTGAGAVTVSFNTYVTGADLGNVELATLEATQNGADVDFKLSATFLAQPTSYIDYLRLNYTGTRCRRVPQTLAGSRSPPSPRGRSPTRATRSTSTSTIRTAIRAAASFD